MFQLYQGVGQRSCLLLPSLKYVCGSLLCWQCRTIPGMLSTLQLLSKNPTQGVGTSASVIYLCYKLFFLIIIIIVSYYTIPGTKEL